MATQEEPAPASQTYDGGCHCGYIKYSVTLSPPLHEQKINNCNCSACTRLGYLLVYPEDKNVTWHNGSRERMANYRFNTKQKDQMFCPKCGTSLGIDFRDWFRAKQGKSYYGLSVRTLNNVDLHSLQYRQSDGMGDVHPAGDTGGTWWDEEKQEMR